MNPFPRRSFRGRPRARPIALAFALALALPPAPGWAQSPEESSLVLESSLSLEEALRIARESNPSYLATRNDRDVAEWELRSAWGSLLPSASTGTSFGWQGSGEQRLGTLTLSDLGVRSQPSYYSSTYDVGLSLVLSGSSLLQPRRARAELDATDARIRSSEALLQQDVTRLYLDALRQDESLALARSELERAELNLRLARAQVEVGTGTPLDARQAEVAVGRTRVSVLQLENLARTSRLRLLTAIGIVRDPSVRLTTRFDLDLPELSEELLLQQAIEGNPGLRALRSVESAARVGVRSARAAYLPSLALRAGYSGFTREASDAGFLIEQARGSAQQAIQQCLAQNEILSRLSPPLPGGDCGALALTSEREAAIRASNDAFPFDFTRSPASASISVSLPVFQGLGRQRTVEGARAAAEDARLRVREEELRLRAELSAALAAVRTAHASALLEEENGAVADDQLRLAREQYRLGSVSFLQLVEAETLKARADRERINAVFAFHDALSALEALVGTPLRTR